MCVECMEQTEVTTIEEPAVSPARLREIDMKIRLKGLERHLLDPETYPVCTRCERAHCASETHDMYNGQCLYCGLNRLEKLLHRTAAAAIAAAHNTRVRPGRRLVVFYCLMHGCFHVGTEPKG
jgi:hypothetical protein